MSWFFPLCSFAACGLLQAGFACGGELPEEGAVSVSLCRWINILKDSGAPIDRQGLFLTFKVMNESDWNVAYGEHDPAGLTLSDSEGASCARVDYSYSEMHFSFLQDSGKERNICLSAKSWQPSAGARWVEVKGKVPFVVSRTSSVSASAELPLVQGASIPLALQGAALDGTDVPVELEVEKCEPREGGKGLQQVELRLKSAVPLGFLDFEVQTRDGIPLLVKRYYSSGCDPERTYYFKQSIGMNGRMEKELLVAVKYATGLKRIMVPVEGRVGVLGIINQQDTPHEKDEQE